MKKIRVYLDNCCFNRPYDNQKQLRIELETKAKLFIQNLILQNKLDLVWSYMLDYENSKNNNYHKRSAIQKWQQLSCVDIDETLEAIRISTEIQLTGLKNADALHLACAICAKSDYFITVDSRVMKYGDNRIVVCDPVEFLRVWEMI